jgi:hypothetical protein
MLLPREQALRFIEGYKSALLRVLSNTRTPTTDSVNDDLETARSLAKTDSGLIEAAFADLAAEGRPIEPEIVEAIRSMKVAQWLYLRQTKTFAVFLDKDATSAYAVHALTTPLYQLVGEPPFAMEIGLFEYEGQFVCDGLALNPVALGPGYRNQLTAAYSRIRKAGRFRAHTEA